MRGGRLWVCGRCGYAQCLATDEFIKEIDEIYSDYKIYHQSHGRSEQAVFEQASGAGLSRSRRLLNNVVQRVKLPATGRMLDFGCGHGAMLAAFAAFIPNWKLAGTELDDTNRAAVESIPGVEKLYVGPDVKNVPGEFDVITMSHVLEHVVEPAEELKRLAAKLTPSGILVIQVPGFADNPFELLVADHRSHFTATTLADLVASVDLEMVDSGDWVPKELNAVARRGRPGQSKSKLRGNPADSMAAVDRGLNWLASVVESCERSIHPNRLACSALPSPEPGLVPNWPIASRFSWMKTPTASAATL